MPRWILSLLLAGACVSCAAPHAAPSPDVAPTLTPDAARPSSRAAAPPAASAAANAKDPEPVPWKAAPVVVELFSSEGCSSCPPADAVLRDLAEKHPVEGAEILALEMHVDYWNDLGWPDPFSSEAFTSRQRVYAAALGDRSIYTPEMVVDGRVGFTGSQRATALRAIARAASEPKAKVEVTRTGDTLSIAVTDLPDASPSSEVLLALAEEGLTTDVPRGENAGSRLAHGPVVRTLEKLGHIPASARGRAFETKKPVTLPATWNRDHVRAVVLVQATDSRAILGAGAVSMK
jgi:hypothetical protein